jgi:hypothetical protein
MRHPRTVHLTRDVLSPELWRLPAEKRERLRRLVLTSPEDDEIARQVGVDVADARAMRRRLRGLGVLARDAARPRPATDSPSPDNLELFP